MRLLLDQGCPRGAVRFLANQGHHAEHVGDLGLAAASDEEILEFARNSSATIISLDSDFHRILALSGATSPSVVRIRIERLKAQHLSDLLVQVIHAVENELSAGAAVSVTSSRLGVRRLPLK